MFTEGSVMQICALRGSNYARYFLIQTSKEFTIAKKTEWLLFHTSIQSS